MKTTYSNLPHVHILMVFISTRMISICDNSFSFHAYNFPLALPRPCRYLTSPHFRIHSNFFIALCATVYHILYIF